MKQRKSRQKDTPMINQLEAELSRVNYRERFRKVLMNTIYTLVVVAALAVLCAVILLPVLRIYGNSMTPTLSEGEIVVCVKGSKVERGDIIGFYYGKKLLVKRCIATEHQWITIDNEGNVYVDNVLLDEPYITEKAFGECNIEFPYQVPDNSLFVMGDHRSTSIDSRNTSVGCVDIESIVGKIVLIIWPLKNFGAVNSGK